MARKAPRHAEAERNDRALLDAARKVLAEDGSHASVAAIAARAGVGIASLYRRYRTKEELFQHLCALSLGRWIDAAEDALTHDDPWEGLVHYVTAAIEFGGGSLGPLAGTISVTDEMAEKFTRSDALTRALVARAHEAGALRADATAEDVSLLVEQLGRSSLVDRFEARGLGDLAAEAARARARTIAIALDGLRAGHPSLPGEGPATALLTERWEYGAEPPSSGTE